MKIITEKIRKQLLANWTDDEGTEKPPLRLFNPVSDATWLIHSMDPENEDNVFGLCDLGMGFPELGYASISDITAAATPANLTFKGKTTTAHYRVERDKFFTPQCDLRTYAEAAHTQRHITLNETHLARAQESLLANHTAKTP